MLYFEMFIFSQLLVNGKPKPLEHDQVKEIKAELLAMRDKINDMIGRLDCFSEEREMNRNIESREAEPKKDVAAYQGMLHDRLNMAFCCIFSILLRCKLLLFVSAFPNSQSLVRYAALGGGSWGSRPF